MGLFNKKGSIKIKDKIWIKKESKLQAFISEWQKDPTTIFIFWFDESLRQTESFFARQATTPPVLLNVRETNIFQLPGKKIILAEHYPLQQKENEFFQKIKLCDTVCWSYSFFETKQKKLLIIIKEQIINPLKFFKTEVIKIILKQ